VASTRERETERGRAGEEPCALASSFSTDAADRAVGAARDTVEVQGGEDATARGHSWPTRQAEPANSQANYHGHPGHDSDALRAWWPRPNR
jgi:hypothetical protein